jgi:hypothetical protein
VRTVVLRQWPIQPRCNQAQPDGRQSGSCQRGTANYRRDPTGRRVDRDQFRVSADDGESNLNPSAQASTSSAKGLYQFIDQTWLGTMKQDGAALGLGRYVDVSEQLPPPPARRPSFESMFTDRVSQPLAPTVATLWGTPPSSGPQNGHAVQVFDLFSDMRPNERKLGDKV